MDMMHNCKFIFNISIIDNLPVANIQSSLCGEIPDESSKLESEKITNPDGIPVGCVSTDGVKNKN
jgi:hypothetical protein